MFGEMYEYSPIVGQKFILKIPVFYDLLLFVFYKRLFNCFTLVKLGIGKIVDLFV